MRSSRPQKTRAQDDECGVRRDPHAEKHRSGWPDERYTPLTLLNGGNH